MKAKRIQHLKFFVAVIVFLAALFYAEMNVILFYCHIYIRLVVKII